MPGVMRPYTIADVLGTMNQQDTFTDQGFVDASGGLGAFSEADETIAAADGAFITAGTAAGWDQGQWGATLWQ